MKRIERVRSREAARVCLVESKKLLKTAMERLLEIDPGNIRLRDGFASIFESHDRVLFQVVDDQSEEV